MFQVAKSQKLQYANFYYQKFTMIKTEDHSYFNSTTTKKNPAYSTIPSHFLLNCATWFKTP